MLLYLRNWCTVNTGNIDEFGLNRVHFLFYGSAWLIAGCMTVCASSLYCEKNYTKRIRIISYITSETELRVAVSGVRDDDINNRENRCRDNIGPNIGLNIFLLSNCIFTSTIIHFIVHIHFFINSVQGKQPPLWFVMLAAFFWDCIQQ